MRKPFIAVSIVLTAALFTGCGAAQSTGDPSAAESSSAAASTEDKVIHVGGTGVSYPGSYLDDGKLIGFDTEVITEAAARAGYSVEFDTMDFSGLLGAVSAGRIDTTATNLTWTEDRAKTYVFSTPYGFDGVGISTAIDNDAIDSLDDLDGKTVGAGAGTTNFAATEAWAQDNGYQITMRAYDTAQSATQDALLGRVDAMARPNGATVAQIAFQDLQLKVVGDLITHEQSRFPFADTERGRRLAAEISDALESMAEDGTLSELAVKYFSYDRSAGADDPHYAVPDPHAISTPDQYA